MPAEEVRASATRDTHKQRLEDWTLLEPMTRACGADEDVVVLLQGEGGARYGSGRDSLAVSDVEVHQTFSPVFCLQVRYCTLSVQAEVEHCAGQ